MITPNKTFELKTLNSGHTHICGVDEVGMGCLAGPVVVCAVKVGKEFYEKNLEGIRDSKLLSELQREKLYKTLITELVSEKRLSYKISLAHPQKIDELNIYQASRWAMRGAIKKVLGPPSGFSQAVVLVDGNKEIPDLHYEQKTVVKGDQKIFAIACASIIAKVYRDRMMKRYSKIYPDYAFEQHKGYSTILHQKQLNKLGPCPIHRRSFRLRY